MSKLENYMDQQVVASGTVTAVNVSEKFISVYEIQTEIVDETEIKTHAIIEFEYNAELEIGNKITCLCTVNGIDKYTENPSTLLSENIFVYLTSPQELVTESVPDTLQIKFKKLNQRISNVITDRIDGEAGAFVSALMLGNKELLESSTIRDFRRAGLSHVLAISGMHLSVLMIFVEVILKKARISKTARGFIVIIFGLFYLALTGFLLSTSRAFIMSTLTYLAFVMQDENDMLTSLLFSLFLILTVSPTAVYDIGLWLSFLAVLGIFVAQYFIQKLSDFLYSKRKREKKKDIYSLKKSHKRVNTALIYKILIYFFSGISITLWANIFICVPAWLYFDEVSLISVPSNLIATPLVSVIMYLSPLFLLVSQIPFLSSFLAFVIEKTCKILLWCISYMVSFNNVTVSMHYKFVGPIVIFVAISLFFCLVLKFKHKWIITIPPLIAAILFTGGIHLDNAYYGQLVQVEYLGAKESEMIVLRDKSNYSIIDISSGGYSYSYDAYINSVDNCATEISSYVLTHYHNYHTNSLRKLLGRATILKLYLPYPQNLDEYYIMSSLITVAQNEKVNVIIYDSESETQITPNVILNLSERYHIKRSTHPTFCFELTAYGKKVMYFAESAFEFSELSLVAPKTEYVILGSHGPLTKSDFYVDLPSKTTLIITSDTITNHINYLNNGDSKVISDVTRIKFNLYN